MEERRHGRGTVLAKEIRPGAAGSELGRLTAAGSLLFFVADDGVNGPELWRNDGTEPGTYLVQVIIPEGLDSYPDRFVSLYGTLNFSADDGAHGNEVWSRGARIFG